MERLVELAERIDLRGADIKNNPRQAGSSERVNPYSDKPEIVYQCDCNCGDCPQPDCPLD